jgi:hypothetical protein
MCHDCGLRILCQGEVGFRAFTHQPEQVLAERFVDFREGIARSPTCLGKRDAHADRLAALTRKEKSAQFEAPCMALRRRLGGRGTNAKPLKPPEHCRAASVTGF